MAQLRRLARVAAYGIAALLSAVWLSSGLASLHQPLFDIGRPLIGDSIIACAGFLSLSPAGTLKFAHMLVGLKLLLGAYLLSTIVSVIIEHIRFGESGDEMLDLGLFVSAVASTVAASPVLGRVDVLVAMTGELMLCGIAGGLTAFAQGVWAAKRPRPHRMPPAEFDAFSLVRLPRTLPPRP